MIFGQKNGQKKISKLLVTIFIISMLAGIPPQGNPVHANDDGDGTSTAYGARITSVKLEIDGQEVEEGTILEEPVAQDTLIKLFYTWEIDNGDGSINAGEKITVEVPEGFLIANDVSGDLSVDEGGSAGTFLLEQSSRELTLTFSDFVEEHLNVKGTIVLDTWFELQSISRENPVEFKFPISDTAEKTIVVKFQPEGSHSPISKSGEANKSVNADAILWTVDVNTALEIISEAVVNDTIGEGQSIIPGSIKVYQLHVDLDGNIEPGNEIDEGYSVETEDEQYDLIVDLGNIAGAYRIQYQTELTDQERAEFDNTAEIGASSSSAAVSVARGALLEKEGAAEKSFNPDYITWTVYANMGEMSLTDAWVEDTIPEGLTLREESVKVYELTLDNDGIAGEADVTSSVDFTADPFRIDLYSTDKAYKIEYITNIADKDESYFENNVRLYEDGDEKDSAQKEVTVSRGVLLEKDGNSFVSYDNKYIDWIIDVNTIEKSIDNAVVTDMVCEGLGLLADTVEVYELVFDDNGDVTDEVLMNPQPSVDVAPEGDQTKITVDLQQIEEAYRIKYRTTIEDINRTEFSNSATLTGTGYGIGPGGITAEKTIQPAIRNTISKATVSGGLNYAEKTMEWKMNIYPTKEPMQGLVIKDTFPDGGLKMLPETLVVKKGTDILTEGEGGDYRLDYIQPDDWTKGFKITFNAPVGNIAYTATYKTSFDRRLHTTWNGETATQRTYANRMEASWNEDKVGAKSDSNQKQYMVNTTAGNNGSKSGALRRAAREIDWIVDVNYLSEAYNGLVVEDEIKDGQELLTETLEVYAYSINGSGGVAEGGKITSGYTVQAASKDGFIIKFDGEINSPYRIRYTTKLVGQSKASYQNTSTAGGTSLSASVGFPQAETFVTKSGSQSGRLVNWEVRANTSLSTVHDAVIRDTLTGEHIYISESFNVFEVQPNNTERKLTEDEYELGIIILDFATNKQGFELALPEIIHSEYIIRYQTFITAGSTGTHNIKNSVSMEGSGVIIINDTVTEDMPVLITGGSGTGEGIVGSLKIEKSDAQDGSKKLPGAVFQLLGSNGSVITELPATDGSGEIIINRLSFGKYFLKEITAPDEYQLPQDAAAVTEVTVSSSAPNPVVEISNEKIRGGIVFKKVDADTGAAVEGAAFELFKENNADTPIAVENSDENGIVSFEDVEYGSYIIKEKSPAEGYLSNDTELKAAITENEVVVYAGPGGNGEDEFALENTVIKGTLRIIKADEDDPDKKLKGAEFEIFKAAAGTEESKGSIITGDNGMAEMLDLPYGKYTVREVNAPYGYYRSIQDYEIEITEEGAVVELEVQNEKIPEGALIINKLNSLSKLGMPGIKFEIYGEADNLLRTVETNEAGVAEVKNLFVGKDGEFANYTIREVETPSGYQPAEVEKAVRLNAGSGNSITIENHPLRTLRIKKVDAGNRERLLAGAVFEVRDSDKKLLGTITTDTGGVAVLENLIYGEYTITEIAAPTGYQLDAIPFSFTIDEDALMVYLLERQNVKRSSGGSGGSGGSSGVIPPKEPQPEVPEEQPEIPEAPEEPSDPQQPLEPEENLKPEVPIIEEKTLEGTPVDGKIQVPEGGAPEVGGQPENGTVTIDEEGNWTYTPDTGFTGTDRFTVKITRSDGTDDEILIEINVGKIITPGTAQELPKAGEGSSMPLYWMGTVLILLGILIKRSRSINEMHRL